MAHPDPRDERFKPGTRYDSYDRAFWARNFEADLEALVEYELTDSIRPWWLGDLHRWLDARDAFPCFMRREDTLNYISDRDEHACALSAAWQLLRAEMVS